MRPALALSAFLAVCAAGAASAQELVLYDLPDFRGQSRVITADSPDFGRLNFNDRARSAEARGRWEVCEHGNFGGRCTVLDGRYPNLADVGLSGRASSARIVFGDRVDGPRLELFSEPGFRGDSRIITRVEDDFRRINFNDRARSARVAGGVWDLCEDGDFNGRCVTLRNDAPDLAAFGIAREVSSAGPSTGRRGDRPGRRGVGVTLFEGPNYTGRFVTVQGDEPDLNRLGFNDDARSARVDGGSWVLCEDGDFEGDCIRVERDIPDLAAFGLGSRVSSVVSERGYDEWRRRPGPGGPGYGRGDVSRPDAEGRTAAFFEQPRYRGQAVDRCARSNEAGCGAEAADRFCQLAGFSESAWAGLDTPNYRGSRGSFYSPGDRSGSTIHVGDGRDCRTGRCQPLQDVLCVR